MNNLQKIEIYILSLVFLPIFAFAQNPSGLGVVFEQDPLFYDISIFPGFNITKTVEVINSSGESQQVATEAINGVDSDGLGDVLNLSISDGVDELYNDTLGNFLRSSHTELTVIPQNESLVYSYSISFNEGAGNEYQDKTLGFDLCIGFVGGELECGGTQISDPESDTDGGGGGGGGVGGGGIVQNIPLEIGSEGVTETFLDVVNNVASALIQWDTNLLSTSQVIYGLESGSHYDLNLTLPNFGYPHSTDEDLNKVTEHFVLLENLIPDEVYVFRVVSRASPPTVSFEYRLVLNSDNEVVSSSGDTETEGIIEAIESIVSENSVGGLGLNNLEGSAEEITEYLEGEEIDVGGLTEEIEEMIGDKDNTENGNLASVFLALKEGFLSHWFWWVLSLILIIYIVYRFTKKKEEQK